MRTSRQARREAKQLFRSCRVDGLLDEGRAREVVRRVLEQKPRGYLAVLGHFQRLVKLEVDRRSALVESAVPLSADLQAGVRGSLEKHYGPGLAYTFRPAPPLVGGMRIKVGSDVFDGSVQARLNALMESF